jgi:hypothetical protein
MMTTCVTMMQADMDGAALTLRTMRKHLSELRQHRRIGKVKEKSAGEKHHVVSRVEVLVLPKLAI